MADNKPLRRSFKFRCYPNVGTKRRIWRAMWQGATPVWNACVAEREESRRQYRAKLDEAFCDFVQDVRRDMTEKEEQKIRRTTAKDIHWPTAYDQYKHVRKGDHPEYARFSASMLQCVVAKVDGSEKSFRALWIKGDKKARPPGQVRVHRNLTFRQSGWTLQGHRLTLMAIGTIRVRMHRPILGKIKTVTVTEKNGCWYVCFSCEIARNTGVCGPLSAPKSGVPQDLRQDHSSTSGADLNSGGEHNSKIFLESQLISGADLNSGGEHNRAALLSVSSVSGAGPDSGGEHNVTVYYPDALFILDSRGRRVPHPAFYEQEIATLRRLSRALSRKKRGSKNRRKARRTLAKWHEHIARKRDYFLWQQANYYARHYQDVTVMTRPAKLPIQYALTSKTAMKLCDASYARFEKMLAEKCEEHHTQLIIKESTTWPKEKAVLREVAQMEQVMPLLRKARKALKYSRPPALRSLRRDCARVQTLAV